MNTNLRTALLLIPIMAGLGGCSSTTHTAERVAARIAHPFSPASLPAPLPAGLDDYKTLVAQRVTDRNPEHRYKGTLPPMLPAIVVLEITVGADGRMTHVEVQRSRDPAAARVALASMRRSEPLPPVPSGLAQGTSGLKFSETFLFADKNRYQLRTLADVQPSE